MKGFQEKSHSKKKTKKNTSLSNKQILNQAISFHSKGNISEASKCYQYLINKGINNAIVLSNYGVILKSNGELNKAEEYQKKAIKLKPDFASAHYNLANIFELTGKKSKAEESLRKSIDLNPDFANAYYNLGNLLYELGRVKEAEINTRKAITINPKLGNAYLNLGAILKDQGKLYDAEIATRKAIELQPECAGAFCNLGMILTEVGKTIEAEVSLRKSIDLNPDLSTAYQNLSLLLYAKGNKISALESIEKSYSLNSNSKDVKLILSMMKARSTQKKDNLDKVYNYNKKFNEPIILKREVAPELINELYKLKTIDLNQYEDPSYGNARGSDYELFEDNINITRVLKDDLISITKNVVKSEVFFRDSFFTILGGGGIINKHNHIGPLDRVPGLDLGKQKYSLVYYLEVGDQNCKNPGILKFYIPQKEILPCKGMIIIFPADRYHSVIYDGKKDRVIVGVNFYSL
ncbi:tetratricopeptide repeat protein [Prochlorococcus sp. MIT 0916]|uniref:tetratricopeptide repeat protein n=1 Tax=Prochlorococcus sp. MIT 0916 TaxID=3082521 RepID=UPI0039B5857B